MNLYAAMVLSGAERDFHDGLRSVEIDTVAQRWGGIVVSFSSELRNSEAG